MQRALPTFFCVVFGSALMCATPAASFENTDFEATARRVQAVLGTEFRGAIAGNQTVRFLCTTCKALRMVTLQMRRSNDGMEERLRSGQATIADLERQCQASEPTCKVTRADIGKAVGWLSSSRGMTGTSATLTLLENGSLFAVRSDASTPQMARQNLDRIRRNVIPGIIGR